MKINSHFNYTSSSSSARVYLKEKAKNLNYMIESAFTTLKKMACQSFLSEK
jgi:hypothetical protein